MVLWHPVMSQLFKEVGSYHDDRAVVQEFRKGVGRMNNFGYVDEYNRLVIPMKYNYAGDFKNGVAIVGIGNRRGIINKSGQVVLPIEYETIKIDAPTGYYTIEKNGKNGVAGKDGKLLVPCKYNSVWIEPNIAEGVPFFVAWWLDGDHYYGDLYNMQGKSLLPNGYSLAHEHNHYSLEKVANEMSDIIAMNRKFQKNGFCVVDKNSKLGVFDPVTELLVLSAEYEWIVIYDDCFLTVKDGLCGLARTDGKEIYPNIYKSIKGYEKFYVNNENDEFAVYDAKKQEEVLPAGCKIVEDNIINCKKYDDNIINCKNQYVLWDSRHSCKYDDCWYDTIFMVPMSRDSYGKTEKYGYVVKLNGKFGLKSMIERNYKYVLEEALPLEYDALECQLNFMRKGDVVFHCRKDGKWGLFSRNTVTRMVSDSKLQESGAFLIAQHNGKYGFYLPNGDIQFKYDSKPLSLGRDQWLVESKGKYGLVKHCPKNTGGGLSASGDEHIKVVMSPSGDYVECLSPVYDAVSTFDKIALTMKDGENGFVWLDCSKEGQTPVELPYQKVEYRGVHQIEDGKTNGRPNRVFVPLFAVMKKDKWGIIGIKTDNSIKVIVKPKYDEIGEFYNSRATVKKGKKSFYIDVNGNEVKD